MPVSIILMEILLCISVGLNFANFICTKAVNIPDTCFTVYKENSGCSDDVTGRDTTADGNFPACVTSNLRKGNKFVVWWNNKCYGGNCTATFDTLDNGAIYDISNCTGKKY